MTKQPMPPNEVRTTNFSECRTYRYHLSQVWNPKRDNLIWLLLNPSTADEVQNDATVERCERRARMWGFGGVEIYNIFAYRATHPTDMKKHADPVGPDNDRWIKDFAKKSRVTTAIIAWGDHAKHGNRGEAVLNILRKNQACVSALKINGSGHPSHPLYLGYDKQPFPFPLK